MGSLEPVEKLRFSDKLCFDFAKHGRPKVPMWKLSPSLGIKTVIHKVNCRIAAREGGLGHAPGIYGFALQIRFYACFARSADIALRQTKIR